MKELSLNILDIAQNSVAAEATLVTIALKETERTLAITIADNGKGMSADFVKSVTDPFSTTRKTRKVGLGLPLLKLAAEQAGGDMSIRSVPRAIDPENCGTMVTASFDKDNIDFTPLGDVISTVTTLIQGCPDIDFRFTHEMPDKTVSLDTGELREVLGEDVPLNEPEVLMWIEESLREQYEG